MEEVSARLEHSGISTTEKGYTHITVAMRRRAAGVLDQLMGYKSVDRGKPKDICQTISKLFEPTLPKSLVSCFSYRVLLRHIGNDENVMQ